MSALGPRRAPSRARARERERESPFSEVELDDALDTFEAGLKGLDREIFVRLRALESRAQISEALAISRETVRRRTNDLWRRFFQTWRGGRGGGGHAPFRSA